MADYSPQQGDIWLDSKRTHLRYCLASNINYGVTPNAWFHAGVSLNEGDIVSVADQSWSGKTPGYVYPTNSMYIGSVAGVVLHDITLNDDEGNNYTSDMVEVQTSGIYKFQSQTDQDFTEDDIGKVVYVMNNTFTAGHPTDGLTTDRNVALLGGRPAIILGKLLGIVKETIGGIDYYTVTIFLDSTGDARLTSSLAQYTYTAGEAMDLSDGGNPAEPYPLVVSEDSVDGKVYLADRRKNYVITGENAEDRAHDRQNVVGFAIANSEDGSYTVLKDSQVVVQRLGVITLDGEQFHPGEELYVNTEGHVIQTDADFLPTDWRLRVGTAVSQTSSDTTNSISIQICPAESYALDRMTIGTIQAVPSVTNPSGVPEIRKLVITNDALSSGNITVSIPENTSIDPFPIVATKGFAGYEISEISPAGSAGNFVFILDDDIAFTVYYDRVIETPEGFAAAVQATYDVASAEFKARWVLEVTPDDNDDTVYIKFNAQFPGLFGECRYLPNTPTGVVIPEDGVTDQKGTQTLAVELAESIRNTSFTGWKTYGIANTVYFESEAVGSREGAYTITSDFDPIIPNDIEGTFSLVYPGVAADDPAADYGWVYCPKTATELAIEGPYSALYATIGNTYGTPVGYDPDHPEDQTTFVLPLSPAEGTGFQIKWLDWQTAPTPNAPLVKYETEYTAWDPIKKGTTISIANVFDGQTWAGTPPNDISDMMFAIYVKKGTKTWKIDPTPLSYWISNTKRYGYQVYIDSSVTPPTISAYIMPDGLAIGTSVDPYYTEIDATYDWKFVVFKTDRFNRYLDYTQEDRNIQMWKALYGLVDSYKVNHDPFTEQGMGWFDRTTTNPINNTRLNYNGDFYSHELHASSKLVVAGGEGAAGNEFGDKTATNPTHTFYGSIYVKNKEGIEQGHLTNEGDLYVKTLTLRAGVNSSVSPVYVYWSPRDIYLGAGTEGADGYPSLPESGPGIPGQWTYQNIYLGISDGVIEVKSLRDASIDESNVVDAALIVRGGASIGKKLIIGNTYASNISISSTTFITTSSTMDLFNAATTVNAFTGATTLNVGTTTRGLSYANTVTTLVSSTDTQTINIGTGNVVSGKTKTINIGTNSGGTGTTSILIGSSTSKTTLSGTLNNVTITQPASSAVLTIADGKTLTVSSTATITSISQGFSISSGTTTRTLSITGGNVALTGNSAGSTIIMAAGTLTNPTYTAVGDIPYVSIYTDSPRAVVLDKLTAGTANYVLTSQGPGLAPVWAAVNIPALGTIGVGGGGTGSTTYNDNAVLKYSSNTGRIVESNITDGTSITFGSKSLSSIKSITITSSDVTNQISVVGNDAATGLTSVNISKTQTFISTAKTSTGIKSRVEASSVIAGSVIYSAWLEAVATAGASTVTPYALWVNSGLIHIDNLAAGPLSLDSSKNIINSGVTGTGNVVLDTASTITVNSLTINSSTGVASILTDASTVTFNLANTYPTTVMFAGNATALTMGKLDNSTIITLNSSKPTTSSSAAGVIIKSGVGIGGSVAFAANPGSNVTLSVDGSAIANTFGTNLIVAAGASLGESKTGGTLTLKAGASTGIASSSIKFETTYARTVSNTTSYSPSPVAIINRVNADTGGRLGLVDTDASHYLYIVPGSNLSDTDKTLTITTGNSDRTLTLNSDVAINTLTSGQVLYASADNTIDSHSGMTYNSGTATLTVANVTGNAGSATKLITARTINGVSFDGTANITISSSASATYGAGSFATSTSVVDLAPPSGKTVAANLTGFIPALNCYVPVMNMPLVTYLMIVVDTSTSMTDDTAAFAAAKAIAKSLITYYGYSGNGVVNVCVMELNNATFPGSNNYKWTTAAGAPAIIDAVSTYSFTSAGSVQTAWSLRPAILETSQAAIYFFTDATHSIEDTYDLGSGFGNVSEASWKTWLGTTNKIASWGIRTSTSAQNYLTDLNKYSYNGAVTPAVDTIGTLVTSSSSIPSSVELEAPTSYPVPTNNKAITWEAAPSGVNVIRLKLNPYMSSAVTNVTFNWLATWN